MYKDCKCFYMLITLISLYFVHASMLQTCNLFSSFWLPMQSIRCKANTSLIGLLCEFCSQRFCLTHHQAEVHGCGKVAKETACRQSQKEWREALSSSSSSSSEKSKGVRRVQLQQKLKSQIGELEGKRTRSTPAKK